MKQNKIQNISTSGFKTPEDYFESFDKKLLSKLNTESDLIIPEKSGFRVPEDYLLSIEEKIIQKTVSKSRNPKIISIFSKRRLVYISSIAAAILLFFNLSIFNTAPSFDNLKTQTVESYVINENISSYEIASLLTEEEINENIFIEHTIEDNTIEEYLLNNSDIETLMIE